MDDDLIQKTADHVIDHFIDALEECEAWEAIDAHSKAEILMAAAQKMALHTLGECEDTVEFMRQLLERGTRANDLIGRQLKDEKRH